MFLTEQVQEFIDRREFPDNKKFLEMFCEGGNLFIDQEDSNWDFKDQWPYSYSDDYFLGIARLVAAFANSSGGLIIFGVHDEKRTGGHNKVKPNTDIHNLIIDSIWPSTDVTPDALGKKGWDGNIAIEWISEAIAKRDMKAAAQST
jgi:hypothetical protein